MGYSALRKGRTSQINRAYCTTTVTYNREKLFTNLYVARIVVNTMKKLHDDNYLKSLSWVLMPDHLHWLFQLKGNCSNEFEPTLSNIMKHLKAITALKINRHLNKNGSIWQKSYYDHGLRDNEDIKNIARYIAANPLRAGLVEHIEDYPHWDAHWL